MKKYPTILTKNELNTLNDLRNDYEIFESTKLNMMSVLGYLIKHGAALKDGLKKSFNDFWDMYKRSHKEIKSISNFKKIIYKLEKANLIYIEKVGKVNIYHARKFLEVTEEVTEEVTDEKPSQSVDMTSVGGAEQNTQIQNIKNNNYINIISNTSKDVKQNDFKNSLAYKKAVEENNQDTLDPTELIMLAKNILKEKKRRSSKLISMVISKLKDKTHIVRANSRNYIEVVIADCIAKFELNRELYALTIAKNKNNYKTAYNKAASTTANFTQRKYNFDKLEQQLLGWCDDMEDDCEI